jgi:hypothetical protein
MFLTILTQSSIYKVDTQRSLFMRVTATNNALPSDNCWQKYKTLTLPRVGQLMVIALANGGRIVTTPVQSLQAQ